MTESSFGLFEPDALLPAQFHQAFGGHPVPLGELRLMAAVLEDGIQCYRKYATAADEAGRQAFAEAMAWIESNDRRYLFSFENVCEMLGLDPDCVREGLRRWHAAVPQPRGGRLQQAALAATG